MRATEKSRGMTVVSWLFILVIIAIVAMVLMRIVPVYLQHYSIVSTLDSLKKDPTVQSQESVISMSDTISTQFQRRLSIENINYIKAEDISVKPNTEGVLVEVAYEVRVPFIANIDFIISFDDSVQVDKE